MINRCIKCCRCKSTVQKHLAGSAALYWNPLLGFCFRGCIPLCISLYLNLQYPLFTANGEVTAFVFSVVLGFIFFCWFQYQLVYFIWVDKAELLKEENKGYNFLWGSVKKDNRWQRAHIFIFIWRRMSLVLMGFWLLDFPGI